jgi:hypothetical protein
MEQVYHTGGTDDERVITDMILIAFFFLLRPGEYTGTVSTVTPFQLQDINLYIYGRHLDLVKVLDVDLGPATLTSYNVRTQKNGHHNEKVIQGSSGDSLC